MKTFEIAPLLLEAHLPEKPDSNHPPLRMRMKSNQSMHAGQAAAGEP